MNTYRVRAYTARRHVGQGYPQGQQYYESGDVRDAVGAARGMVIGQSYWAPTGSEQTVVRVVQHDDDGRYCPVVIGYALWDDLLDRVMYVRRHVHGGLGDRHEWLDELTYEDSPAA